MIGISLGIMTVVALGAITGGLGVMAGDLAYVGHSDFIAGQKGSSDLSFCLVSEADLQQIKSRPDVESAVGVLLPSGG